MASLPCFLLHWHQANIGIPHQLLNFLCYCQIDCYFIICFNFVGLCSYFSRLPHVAGSARNNELGREIARRWEKYGFDKVEMPRYDILLSLPDDKNPSSVSIVSREGQVKTRYPIKEKVI